MEFITSTAISFLLKGLAATKAGKKATEDMSAALWQWIEPLLLKDDESIVKDLEKSPEDEDLQAELLLKLKRKAKNDDAFAALLKDKLKAAAGSSSGEIRIINQTHSGGGNNEYIENR